MHACTIRGQCIGLFKLNFDSHSGMATNGAVCAFVACFFEFSRNLLPREFQKNPHFLIIRPSAYMYIETTIFFDTHKIIKKVAQP